MEIGGEKERERERGGETENGNRDDDGSVKMRGKRVPVHHARQEATAAAEIRIGNSDLERASNQSFGFVMTEGKRHILSVFHQTASLHCLALEFFGHGCRRRTSDEGGGGGRRGRDVVAKCVLESCSV